MTKTAQIKCVNKRDRDNPWERIINVGGVNHDGTRWKQSQEQTIREIETGNDFVIISAIELEPSDSQPKADANASGDQGSQPDPMGQPFGNPGAVRRPTGRTLGQVVSLRIEMAAYFRRPMAAAMEVPAAPAPQQQ